MHSNDDYHVQISLSRAVLGVAVLVSMLQEAMFCDNPPDSDHRSNHDLA